MFEGTTSWEQYQQVFDAIVLSNGWDDATAASEPIVVHSAGGSPDLSRGGAFDVSHDSSNDVVRGYSGDDRRSGLRPPAAKPEVFGICWGARIGPVADPFARVLLHHMTHDEAVTAALQLQHDAGLMMTNLQILSQFVTSLNRMSSEVLRLAFGREPYPANSMQAMLPYSRVPQAAHYLTAMGLWRPTDSPCVPGPVLESYCNDCMMCANCFPKLGP